MIGYPAPLHRGVRTSNHDRGVIEEMHGADRVPNLNTDSERAWVGRAKATASTRAKWRSSTSACCSVLKSCLTPPTLSSRWGKSGRGGTEDETVKLLDGIQRVQVPPGHSRADRPEASVAIHRATGGCEAYTARKQAVKIQLRKLGWLRCRRR